MLMTQQPVKKSKFSLTPSAEQVAPAAAEKKTISLSFNSSATQPAAPQKIIILSAAELAKKQRLEEEAKKLEEKRAKIRAEQAAKDLASGKTKVEEKVEEKPKSQASNVVVAKKQVETKTEREARQKAWLIEESQQRQKLENKIANNDKPLSIILSGHVDHGKSSMSGHILVNLGQIDERTVQKLKQEAGKLAGESWMYAFALDACPEEREKGKTVESARATFTTPSGRRVVLLDSPGHKGFIQSMIDSAAQADVGVLVTSARKGEFEAGLQKGGQTAEHALILFVSGITNLIITVNKMDDPTCAYDKFRFDYIKQQLTQYLTKTVGFKEENLQFIPVSAMTGENLTCKLPEDSKLNSWYQGPNLMELIDTVKIPKRDVGGFLRACVSGKYREQGYYAVAKIEKGQIKKGDMCRIVPTNDECQILGIEDEVGNIIESADAGENCRIIVDEKSYASINAGTVICDKKHPVDAVKTFIAKISCIECPSVLSQGFSATVHINTAVSPCSIKSIVGILDPVTGKIDPSLPKFVKPGQSALIEFECEKEMCVNKFDNENFLGRVLVRYEAMTVGIGMVVKVVYSE